MSSPILSWQLVFHSDPVVVMSRRKSHSSIPYNLELQLPSSVYTSGQTITGNVFLALNKEIEVTSKDIIIFI